MTPQRTLCLSKVIYLLHSSHKVQAFAKGHMQHRSCFNASGTRLIGGLDLLIICQFVTAGLQGVGEGESFCLVLSLNAELGCQNLHPTTRGCEKKSQTILFFLLFPAGYAALDVLLSHHVSRNVYGIYKMTFTPSHHAQFSQGTLADLSMINQRGNPSARGACRRHLFCKES